ncbi:MAG TPA: hypothetical protein VK934_07940, partial [Fimbriimonas sp.]|nr:hypothetical protein [Fimbriimonas sp.]
MSREISRREVLIGGAALMTGLAATNATAAPANRRLRVGIIGSGGKGWSGMMQAAEHGDIVA